MASEMMDGFIAGKMDSNGGSGCCYPVMPMMPYGYGMPYNMGMGYGMGGMWGDWIPLLFIFALLGGNGFGGFGGFGGGVGLQGIATRADINEGFALQNITGGITGISQGICDATYNINNSLTNGFHGVDSAICNLGYQVQNGINGISREIGDCCCKTQTAIQGVNFNLAKGLCDLGNVITTQTRDLVDNQNANYRGIMDFLVQEKLASKDAKIADLQLQASQANQNNVLGARIDAAVAEILRRTGSECPSAAYIVNPPTPVTFRQGCGCGCGNNGFAYGQGFAA